MDPAIASRSARFSRRSLVMGAAAVSAALWWQWPVLAGHQDRIDVVVVTDGLLGPASDALEYHLRDSGRAIAVTATGGWCDPAVVAATIDMVDSSGTVVLSVAGDEPCAIAEAVSAFDDAARQVIVVRRPGTWWPDDLVSSGAVLVEPERLVGDGAPSTVLACQWWDAVWLEPCGVDGAVPVTDASGSLTEQGNDRLARMVTAAIAG